MRRGGGRGQGRHVDQAHADRRQGRGGRIAGGSRVERHVARVQDGIRADKGARRTPDIGVRRDVPHANQPDADAEALHGGISRRLCKERERAAGDADVRAIGEIRRGLVIDLDRRGAATHVHEAHIEREDVARCMVVGGVGGDVDRTGVDVEIAAEVRQGLAAGHHVRPDRTERHQADGDREGIHAGGVAGIDLAGAQGQCAIEVDASCGGTVLGNPGRRADEGVDDVRRVNGRPDDVDVDQAHRHDIGFDGGGVGRGGIQTQAAGTDRRPFLDKRAGRAGGLDQRLERLDAHGGGAELEAVELRLVAGGRVERDAPAIEREIGVAADKGLGLVRGADFGADFRHVDETDLDRHRVGARGIGGIRRAGHAARVDRVVAADIDTSGTTGGDDRLDEVDADQCQIDIHLADLRVVDRGGVQIEIAAQRDGAGQACGRIHAGGRTDVGRRLMRRLRHGCGFLKREGRRAELELVDVGDVVGGRIGGKARGLDGRSFRHVGIGRTAGLGRRLDEVQLREPQRER